MTAVTQKAAKAWKKHHILSPAVLRFKLAPLWHWNALLLNRVLLANKDSRSGHTFNNARSLRQWRRFHMRIALSASAIVRWASSVPLCRTSTQRTDWDPFPNCWFWPFFFVGIVSAVCSMEWNLAGGCHFHYKHNNYPAAKDSSITTENLMDDCSNQIPLQELWIIYFVCCVRNSEI